MPLTLRFRARHVAMILVGVLLVGALAPESYEWPTAELRVVDMPWPPERPRPAETLVEPGEWIDTPIPDQMMPIGFVEVAGTLHLALLGDKRKPGEAHLLTWEEDGWSAPTAPIVHPEESDLVHKWSAVVPFGEAGVVMIGSRSWGGGPISAVTTDLETFDFSTNQGKRGDTVHSAASDGTAVVAIGHRSNRPKGRRTAAWRTIDGVTWTELALPELPVSAQLIDITVSDGTWVIATQSKKQQLPPAVLVSTNTVDWAYHELPMRKGNVTVEIDSIGHDGAGFVILGRDKHPSHRFVWDVTWRSTSGDAWTEPEGPSPAVFGTGNLRIRTGESTALGFLVSAHTLHRADILHCYDDPRACRQRVRGLWLSSDGSWQRLGAPPRSAPLDVAAYDNTIFAIGADRGPVVAYWAPSRPGTLPVAHAFDPTPPSSSLPIASEEDKLVPGEIYAYPLGKYRCSAGRFNGREWFVADVVPDAKRIIAVSGAMVEGKLYGTVEQIDDDRIEYSIPGHGPVAYLRRGIPKECGPGVPL